MQGDPVPARALHGRAHLPEERVYQEQIEASGDPHPDPEIEESERAKAIGLWNLFLPDAEYGAGLTNLEYAPLCEIMGRSPIAARVLTAPAPDTGNMEILAEFGTPAEDSGCSRSSKARSARASR